MRASQELRWKQRIKENEERRRWVCVLRIPSDQTHAASRHRLTVKCCCCCRAGSRRYDEVSKRLEEQQKEEVSKCLSGNSDACDVRAVTATHSARCGALKARPSPSISNSAHGNQMHLQQCPQCSVLECVCHPFPPKTRPNVHWRRGALSGPGWMIS